MNKRYIHITKAGETKTVKASATLHNLHFWSWGYGYLYTVKTALKDDNNQIFDEVSTRTGFRKTRFAEGKIWLNDRVIQMKGYAQRTSNEWPAVGLSVPAWLSDFSNDLMVKGNANLVRWMHATPWKQDVESCDRVGLIQAMPAGDAEKDREGRQWEQRVELMRDAIIYNRNNPSILFYECGNKAISREHMIEMKAVRDKYDPFGGRAIGSREMLDIREAEYGGEMLYINRSEHHPMWATEYCRDEGLRKYWDEYSYPFHKEGDGPLYKGQPATDYNRNQDELAITMIARWYDYWRERPGTGNRVSSGGTKIIFSDTNTHYRGAENYRRSGVTDAMRIEKDAFYAHQVMWDGWVDTEKDQTYIIGHWNYPDNTVKPVQVVSTGEEVELFLNGNSLGKGKRQYNFLFTFDNVAFKPGKLEAARIELKNLLNDMDVYVSRMEELLQTIEEKLKTIPYVDKLMEIKGIGLITVSGFIAEVGDIGRFDNPKQLQKLAGYAIVANDSGKHNGESRISYRGRKRLRYVLYEAAISLVGKNAEFKEIHEYYRTRKENPLKKMQSVVAVACKIIRVFYTILTKGVDYDPMKLMSDIRRPQLQAA